MSNIVTASESPSCPPKVIELLAIETLAVENLVIERPMITVARSEYTNSKEHVDLYLLLLLFVGAFGLWMIRQLYNK